MANKEKTNQSLIPEQSYKSCPESNYQDNTDDNKEVVRDLGRLKEGRMLCYTKPYTAIVFTFTFIIVFSIFILLVISIQGSEIKSMIKIWNDK